MDLKKKSGPALKNTNTVKNMIARLSSDEMSVDNFFDSHRKGLKSVAVMAAGAMRIRLCTDPSYSTPNEKFEVASSCSA